MAGKGSPYASLLLFLLLEVKEYSNPATHALTFGLNNTLVGYTTYVVTQGWWKQAVTPWMGESLL